MSDVLITQQIKSIIVKNVVLSINRVCSMILCFALNDCTILEINQDWKVD